MLLDRARQRRESGDDLDGAETVVSVASLGSNSHGRVVHDSHGSGVSETTKPSRPAEVTFAHLRSDGTAYVVAGSAVAGLGAYAYQLLGGRVLGPEAFAPVSVLLTIHFLTFIVLLLPIEQLIVRRLTIDPHQPGLTRQALLLGGATVVGTTILALSGVDRFLNGDYRFVVFAALTVGAHFLFAAGRGHLAGRRRFVEYGMASGSASLVRLGIAVLITLVHPSASGFALGLIAGPLIVLLLRPSRPADSDHVGVAVPAETTDRGLLTGMVVAAAASQALLLAGPLVVGGLGGSAVEVSIAFAVFTLGRAPLVFGYNLLARVLPPFTRMAVEGQGREMISWARGMTWAGFGLSAMAAFLGWLFGPWAVRIAFGPEFITSGFTTAVVAGGVVLAGAGLFVGQILVADGRTDRLAIAWAGGLLAAITALIVTPDTSVITRVAVAFLAGEAVALLALVHGAVIVARTGEQDRPRVAYKSTKRTIDIAVSLTGLVLLIPVFLIAGLAVRLNSPGPIFFRQTRLGRSGRPFGLLKIRTMEADADEAVFAEHLERSQEAHRPGADPSLRIAEDDRVTPVGRLLRRWSIDELPNLWNVLGGSMSLVGPRPLVKAEAELIGLENSRFIVKPGVTGLAQVNGRDLISMSDRTRLDEEYVRSRSTRSDLTILLKTVETVFEASQ